VNPWQDNPEDTARFAQRLQHVRARVEHGLKRFRDWPPGVPAKVAYGHAAAMVAAAMEATEKTGQAMHQVVFLGQKQVRLNAMLMYRTGETRDETQAHKVATWLLLAKLFNLLDAEVSLWLSDAWMSVLKPEDYETGPQYWPKDDPERYEALTLDVVTPTGGGMVMCRYDRQDDGSIRWGMFQGGRQERGMAFVESFLPLVERHADLRPQVLDGQHRGLARSDNALQPSQVVADLTTLGHHIVSVDERFLRTN
jgi:hypothetical protein